MDFFAMFMPAAGIEPVTYALRVRCSTDWAKLANLIKIIEEKEKIVKREMKKCVLFNSRLKAF